MKIFDYTDGKKGALLAEAGYCHSTDGWLARKGDKVFKVSLAAKPKKGTEWSWQSGAAFKNDKPIRPEDFGVQAICFCTGAVRMSGMEVWRWHVVGTAEWNKAACQKGILKAEFSHLSTAKDRAQRAADDLVACGTTTTDYIIKATHDYDTTEELIREALVTAD